MDDLDCLKLAGSAIGLNEVFFDSHLGRVGYIDRGVAWTEWNPLAYDGDAFSLAAKLKISVIQYSSFIVTSRRLCDGELLEVRVDNLASDNDSRQTRRAVTQCAALIGEREKHKVA